MWKENFDVYGKEDDIRKKTSNGTGLFHHNVNRRRRAEPSWQIHGEVARHELELHRKKCSKGKKKLFRMIKILNSVPSAVDMLVKILEFTIL